MLGDPLFIFANKLKRLKGTLINWNKEHFGNIFQKVSDAKEKVKEAEIRVENDDSEQATEDLVRSQNYL